LKQRIIGSYNKLKETNILSNFFNLSGIQISNILLLLLTIRIITGIVGIAEFGIIMWVNRFAQFIGSMINYGTNQSAVRDVAGNLNNKKELSSVFYNTIWIRVLIFLLFLGVLPGLRAFNVPYYSYIILAIPIVLAEVFNPLCFYIGFEKLRVFNLVNLVFNIIAVTALLIFIKARADAGWVNFILGAGNVVTYLGLLIYLGAKNKLRFRLPLKSELFKIAKGNFYLTINNISGIVQQSFILFALAKWSNVNILGAYSICDRIIGQCRSLFIIISNSIYPNAVHIYKQSTDLWNVYRKKAKYLLAGLWFAAAIFIVIFADLIIFILTKEHDATAVLFLRIMAFVPVVSSFNVLNILDQLLKNNMTYIFRIAVILVVIAPLTAFILLYSSNTPLIGTFTLIVETSSCLMYEYVVKKFAVQNA